MMATAASRYDLARFGMERMSFSPRQADLLICAGRVSYKMAPVLKRIWEQMPSPKWSISMGACASSGGVFDVYSMVQGIDTIIPVDVYVPGCPPRPEGLIYGILLIQEKIRQSEEAQLTTEQAADAIRASHSKISRMERGRVSFKERDIADLLSLYGVADPTEREGFLALAREKQARGYRPRIAAHCLFRQ